MKKALKILVWLLVISIVISFIGVIFRSCVQNAEENSIKIMMDPWGDGSVMVEEKIIPQGLPDKKTVTISEKACLENPNLQVVIYNLEGSNVKDSVKTLTCEERETSFGGRYDLKIIKVLDSQREIRDT